jgi:tetratricopeptide (TPR) repeat protein
LGSNALDLESILGELEGRAAGAAPSKTKRKPKAHAEQESVEVDLSVDLDGINTARTPIPIAPQSTRGGPQIQAAQPENEPEQEPYQENDIDSVFAQLRSEASRKSTGDGAEEQMKHGTALRDAGQLDQAIQAFELASRSPRHRFQASACIARIYREREENPKAIEWFERATQAPAPTPDDGFALLYELADTHESMGETARALAVCLELVADAGDFRDVKARVSRLSQVQARG